MWQNLDKSFVNLKINETLGQKLMSVNVSGTLRLGKINIQGRSANEKKNNGDRGENGDKLPDIGGFLHALDSI